jgi:hypothetical protein
LKKEPTDKVVSDNGALEADDDGEEDLEERDAMEVQRTAEEREQQRKELESMFDDDTESSKPLPPKEPKDEQRDEPEEDPKVDDENVDQTNVSTPENHPDSMEVDDDISSSRAKLDVLPASEPNKPKRGRRKVTRTIRKQDANGYLVTTTESVWESCSEDETHKPAAPAKAQPLPKIPPRKGKTGGGGGGGQTSLMSFFKK